jgi:alpha-D-ribose 1-methylphosphonate 5-triphosphate diphosphatase PhnM
MGLFDIFRKKRKKTNGQGDLSVDQILENKQAIEKISSDVENLKAQVNTVNIALKKHDDQFIEHIK